MEFTDGKAIFNIVNVGAANWAIQMKQSGLAIEPGATYRLTMKLTSAVTRKIEVGLMDASSSTYYGGDETVDNNLIQNGNFTDAATGWNFDVTAPGAGSADFSGGKAVCTVTGVGDADWNLQLNQSGITLEKGAAYQLKIRLRSSVSRTVLAGFQNAAYDWYGGAMVELNAGEWKDVDTTFTVNNDTDTNIKFYLSMGKNTDVETPEGMVEIESVSLVKTADGQ